MAKLSLVQADCAFDFSPVRKHLDGFNRALNDAVVRQILIGEELAKLHAKHGIHAGRRAVGKQLVRSELIIPWDDLVKQETGLSHSTAWRCMTLAKEAGKRVGQLRKLFVENAPVEKIIAVLTKATAGKSARQLMLEWAEADDEEPEAKEAKRPVYKIGGGKGGKAASGEDAAAEARLAAWQEMRGSLETELGLHSYADLPTPELLAWQETISRLTEALRETLRTRKGDALKSLPPGGGAPKGRDRKRQRFDITSARRRASLTKPAPGRRAGGIPIISYESRRRIEVAESETETAGN